MVGRLVEEEDVGFGSEHPGQRGTARLAAREALGLLVAAEAELIDHEPRAVGIVARGKARLDVGEGRRELREVGLLRQVADGHRRLAEALAAVEPDEPGGDLEERRFSRAVPADDAEPLSRPDAQVDAAEKRRPAEGQSDVLEKEKRWRRQGVIQSRAWAAEQFRPESGATDYHA